MAKARKCDICGTLYESYNIRNDSENPNSLQFMSVDINDGVYRYKSIDCCPTCMESIKNHLEKLRRDVL